MFGGLEKSIEVAAEMAGLENYRVQSLPKLEDPLSMIMKEITGVKTRMIKNELGDDYMHYKRIQEIREMRGLQAILPYDIELH
jgi:protease-4